jgi:MFS family permease
VASPLRVDEPRAVAREVSSAPAPSVVRALAPIMAVVLVAYLIIGLAMPVLPLYVHNELGLSTFMVGVAAGVEFAAALASRFWAGHYADTRGAKRAMIAGLGMGVVAGLFYLGSLRFAHAPSVGITVLLVGRVFLGGAESFVITGALSQGLVVGGAPNAGRVIAWIGTALWAAYGAGAPAGTALYARFGFAGIAAATMLLPLVTLLLVARIPALPPTAVESPSFRRVVGAVWVPGLGVGLTAVGFGAITTFAALMFVALFCVLVESSGLALIWLAPSATIAFVGATITGAGYSLVYPGFGLEAVRRAPPEAKGLAMGAFTAFLDLALGVATPALGLVADHAGLSSVFLVSTVVTLGAAVVAARLLRAPSVA